mmetsp:Transcript_6014/g.14381  ORF Transcript_6014/g.14381 Transcript_6014/m.14381 type:complete len:214 (-) Transcript_6014:610-1251(-)
MRLCASRFRKKCRRRLRRWRTPTSPATCWQLAASVPDVPPTPVVMGRTVLAVTFAEWTPRDPAALVGMRVLDTARILRGEHRQDGTSVQQRLPPASSTQMAVPLAAPAQLLGSGLRVRAAAGGHRWKCLKGLAGFVLLQLRAPSVAATRLAHALAVRGTTPIPARCVGAVKIKATALCRGVVSRRRVGSAQRGGSRVHRQTSPSFSVRAWKPM